MRLFAAIRPPEHVLAHLELPLTNLRLGAGAPLRWVPMEQQHITLAFYGEVPDGAAQDVADHLAEAVHATAPLDLHLRGGGSFNGRTLWVGVGGQTRSLTGLMAAAATAPFEVAGDEDDEEEDARERARGRAAASAQERRRAHLTVARESRRSERLAVGELARALAVYSGPEWQAATVELVSSRLGEGRSGGPAHETLAEIPLAGA